MKFCSFVNLIMDYNFLDENMKNLENQTDNLFLMAELSLKYFSYDAAFWTIKNFI